MVLNVGKQHAEYLRWQRGDIWDQWPDFDQWLRSYKDAVLLDWQTLQGYIPKFCGRILDVGSGLSGVGVYLKRQFPNAEIYLLDGADDKPECRKHSEPFNSVEVTRDFWAANDVEFTDYLDARKPEAFPQLNFDLIISLRSWCFHYPPHVYLPYVLQSCYPYTDVIVDLRRDRGDWREMLVKWFRMRAMVAEFSKANRIVMATHPDKVLFR